MEAMPPLDEATYMARFNAPAVVASGPSLSMVRFWMMTGVYEPYRVLIHRCRFCSSGKIVFPVVEEKAFDREQQSTDD